MRTLRLVIPAIFFSVSVYSQSTTTGFSGVEFIENKNQWDKNVLYKADISGGAVFLEKNCLTFSFKDVKAIDKIDAFKHLPPKNRTELKPGDYIINCHAYKIIFLNSSAEVTIKADNKCDGFYNFFLGNDMSKWASGVYSYRQVVYSGLYDKTDLKIYENASHLKYDIILHPGADAANIKLVYDGADQVLMNDNNLVIKTSVNEITELRPEAYQLIDGKKIDVPCSYVLHDTILSFAFPSGYEKTADLIIDPTLVFSTYSGSSADNWGFTATYDTSGCVYSGGIAFGTGYPVSTGVFQINFAGGDPMSYSGGCDAAIIKYNPTGTQRLWASYLGGSGEDLPHSMIVNNNNQLVIYGTTGSSDFPVTPGAYDQTFNGGTSVGYDAGSLQFTQGIDIFVSKISSDGTQLLASTYVGGSANDGLNDPSILSYNYGDGARGEIMVDNNNNVYVVSTTNSTNFPVTATAFQTSPGGGGQDGVVFKMNTNLSNMIWSSYIGGSGADAVYGIVLDANNNLFITGGTSSTNFPTTAGTLHPSYIGGQSDGFITEINSTGSAIIRSTYYGSDAYDQSYNIAIGNGGKIYVYGQTAKTGNAFIYNATWATPGGGQFISKIEPTLSTLIWSTAFGTGMGGPDISPNAFCVDNCQHIYMSGWGGYLNGFGGTTGLPISSNAFQNTTDGNDFYFLVIDDNASSMVYGSYFGGSTSADHVDGGTSRFDSRGVIYNAVCAGCGGYSDFPVTPGVWSPSNGSWNCNNAVIKYDFQLTGVNAVANAAPSDTGCVPFTVNFVNTSNGAEYFWDFDDGTTSTLNAPSHTFTSSGSYHVMFVAIDSAKCNIADTIYLQIEVLSNPVVDLGNDTMICSGATFVLDAGNLGSDFLWSTGASTQTITVSDSGTYWVEVDNGICSAYDTIHVTFAALFVYTHDTTICEGTDITLDAGASGNNFLWSTGATTQTIVVDTSGSYWVSFMMGSCPVVDTINVFIQPLQVVDLGNDTLFCQSVSATLDAGNPGSTYLWSTGENTQTINIDTTGTFWVIVSNAYCSASDTIKIFAVYPPDLGPDAKMCDKDYVTLDAGTTHGDIFWSTGETTQTIHVSETGTYWVQVVSPDCIVSDTIKVEKGGSFTVFFPNTFTPDNDGLNDVFTGVGEEITYYNLTIFTRWGQEIFHTTDPGTAWDGTFEGRKVQQDVYVWMADFQTSCTGLHVQHKIGRILVLR